MTTSLLSTLHEECNWYFVSARTGVYAFYLYFSKLFINRNICPSVRRISFGEYPKFEQEWWNSFGLVFTLTVSPFSIWPPKTKRRQTSKFIPIKVETFFYIGITNINCTLVQKDLSERIYLWLFICCKTTLKKTSFFFLKKYLFFTKHTLFAEKNVFIWKKKFILKHFFIEKNIFYREEYLWKYKKYISHLYRKYRKCLCYK